MTDQRETASAGNFERHSVGRLGRYRQVIQILARHGFGWLLAQLGLGKFLPFPMTLLVNRDHRAPHISAEHVRQALEELGATFIKLGQILSTRTDLIPPDLVAELSKLQDAVPPEPLSTVEAQIYRELGMAPSELFAEFDPKPLGSASIGQVHAARLKTGEEVVVKVQRPGVDVLVEEDLAILMDLARLAARRTVWGQIYDLPAMVEEFAYTLRGEMDYRQEGRNADRIRRSFADNPDLQVPVIYWQYTTRRVLTMSRLRGTKISDLAVLDENRVERRHLAETGAKIVLKMVLEDGFFHADPHPGNFLVMEDGVIGLLDYGMVGQVSNSTREGLLYLMLAVANQDLDRVVDQLGYLGVVGTTVQLERLQRDLGHLLSLYWGLPMGEIDVARILEEALSIARRHHLRVPTNLVLLGKTMAMNEALARTLDPDFSTATVLQPYIRRLALERYMPQHWGEQLFPSLVDLSHLSVTLPRRTERLLTRMEQGNLSFDMRLHEMEHVLDVLNAMVNRLILALLVSSFAVALALLIQIYYTGEPRWVLGWMLGLGMAGVAGLGIWLAANILRGGH